MTALERLLPGAEPRTVVRQLSTLPEPIPAEYAANATVAEPFRLHNCGLVGSRSFTRDVRAGARVHAEPSDSPDLLRVWLDGRAGRGALVDAEHVRLDEDVRRGP